MKTQTKIAIAVGCIIALIVAYYFLFVYKKNKLDSSKRSDKPAFAPNSPYQTGRVSAEDKEAIKNAPSVDLGYNLVDGIRS